MWTRFDRASDPRCAARGKVPALTQLSSLMRWLVVGVMGLGTHAAFAAELAPGVPIFGERRFIEYVPGDLPIILSAPHGGHLEPEEIPRRDAGVRESDANTQELARAIAEVMHERTGRRLHLIICHLHRGKLDANREIKEAAGSDPLAQQAWRSYHAFIEDAGAAAVAKFGSAFVIDLHGHGHPGQRVELGYLHSTEQLAMDDAALNAPEYPAAGSLALIAARSPRPYTDLLRGEVSLGALLEAQGFKATPSPSAPHPLAPYFRGGYTIARHARASAKIAGLQIECFRAGLRDTAENRHAFAVALVSSLERFLPDQLGLTLDGRTAAPVPPAGPVGR